MGDAFLVIFRTNGLRGLWKGSVPNVQVEDFVTFCRTINDLQRAALVNLGDLTTYDMVKHFILRHTEV